MPADEVPAESLPVESAPVGSDAGKDEPFLIVGVGASAGGIEAVTELLKHLPAQSGIAFVLIQHLDPRHKSSLPEILARASQMPVVEIVDTQPVRSNHVYVTPSDKDVAVMHRVLHLMQRPDLPGRHMPVDYFFRSLAEDQGNRAVAVVLSGTGADGTAGLRTIKGEGGITFAQSSESAKFAAMPESAVHTGDVDFVLAPKQIAEELVRLSQHPRLRFASQRAVHTMSDSPEAVQKIFVLLRKTSGVDFTHYKQSTVERRLARRMLLHRIESIQQYAKFLEQTPGEASALFEDMLINVTGFFRDPKVFDCLKEKVFPKLFERYRGEEAIRIWVPACSTGEEPYSIAIAVTEYMTQGDFAAPVQIFATDISETAIERARQGRYPEDIALDVSSDRLRRFFTKTGGTYQIGKAIRDMCVFARQNVTRDPPFSGLDLLSCRNLLIYMGQVFQRRILPTFHYALKPTGFLMLGQSETVGGFTDLFTIVDRVHKIYTKRATSVRVPLNVEETELPVQPGLPGKPPAAGVSTSSEISLERQADRAVLERFAPPGVIVSDDLSIVQFRGQTGRYLEPAPGAATWNVIKMAREGLAMDLRAALHKARKQNARTVAEGLHVRYNGHLLTLDVEVIPLLAVRDDERYFLVLFQEREAIAVADAQAGAAPAAKGTDPGKPPAVASEEEKHVERLRAELTQTKDTLQNIIEEHETTNEELRAANEEIQSSNEELQSTNEELETAKEELQSTNEELTTLNTELESQNLELNQAIDDFNNLHNSVNIPVVLLGTDLRIRTFTPPAERSLKLIPADSGRPIGELKLGIEVQDLERKVLAVIDTLDTQEEEVSSHNGRCYLMRIRPYRTTENKITGAVLALVDITERKAAEEELREAKAFSENILGMIREPVLVLDSQLRVKTVSQAFCRLFGETPAQIEGRLIYDLGNGQWNIPQLRRLLTEVIPNNAVVDGFEVIHDFPQLGRRRMLFNARKADQGKDRPALIVLAIETQTE